MLDIGCNAGFCTFALAQRGASVVGLDVDPHYLRQAEWAARQYGLTDTVEFIEASVYDLQGDGDAFDLVWFMGVLYHLRHPLLALDLLRHRVARLLVLQTLTLAEPDDHELSLEVPLDIALDDRARLMETGWPRLSFVEHRLAGDPTNWWVPNTACVAAMLRSADFREVGRPDFDTFVCEPSPQRPGGAPSREITSALHRAMRLLGVRTGSRRFDGVRAPGSDLRVEGSVGRRGFGLVPSL